MREEDREAFRRAVSAATGVEVIEPFKFSRHATDAVSQLIAEVLREVELTFRSVGGLGPIDAMRLEGFVRRLGTDDRLRIDGQEYVVEYDERLHFTGFRGVTLTSPLYERLRLGFSPSAYASVCGTFRMTGSSGRAHNKSAHKNFRCPTSPGECRHRQRAFYDFLKDVLLGLRLKNLPALIRVSHVTDVVGSRSLRDILDSAPLDGELLANHLREKISGQH